MDEIRFLDKSKFDNHIKSTYTESHDPVHAYNLL